jgi:ABC-type multidrug transport system fused ATPase/permease subunit
MSDGERRDEDWRPDDRHGVDWREVGRTALLWFVVAVLAVLIALGLAAFVPRWWAQVVGGLVEGSFSLGAWWGLAIGFVFTALPLAVAWQGVKPHRSWQTRLAVALTALILAVPNVLTLSVVLGGNEAALAGRRIMDVDAPAFRGATGWGAILAVVVVAALIALLASYRRRGRELKRMRRD